MEEVVNELGSGSNWTVGEYLNLDFSKGFLFLLTFLME